MIDDNTHILLLYYIYYYCALLKLPNNQCLFNLFTQRLHEQIHDFMKGHDQSSKTNIQKINQKSEIHITNLCE